MRGKRSKQYKKLMQQYGLAFGFREPYQVLLDADVIRDADKFKMDLVGGLERTLHGQVKPSIDNTMLDAPPLQRRQRTRRLLPHRQSQALRAPALRPPPRRLPRTTLRRSLHQLRRRRQGLWAQQALLRSRKPGRRGAAEDARGAGRAAGVYQPQRHDYGADGGGVG
ncbi:hypothetical protein V498_10466 [Pseudogymnoascus sp. VKM F-4517 (FW-2822)]|nr:hypothetical protein V498_10466 [Pseudogymnoascus sp. VKM F-4517 (FW-2822)]